MPLGGDIQRVDDDDYYHWHLKSNLRNKKYKMDLNY